MEKIIGIEKHAGKVRKYFFTISVSVSFCMFSCSKGHSIRAYLETISTILRRENLKHIYYIATPRWLQNARREKRFILGLEFFVLQKSWFSSNWCDKNTMCNWIQEKTQLLSRRYTSDVLWRWLPNLIHPMYYLGNHGVSSEYFSFFFHPAIISLFQFEIMMTYSIFATKKDIQQLFL